MNSILSEKEYQKFILERLEQDNEYIIRDSKKYDRYYAVDRELTITISRRFSTICTEADGMKRELFKAILPALAVGIWGLTYYPVCNKAENFDSLLF